MSGKDPRDANIYTADKGQPPSPNEGPTVNKPDPRDANIFTADKGIKPPSPNEGPTKNPKPKKMAKGGMCCSASSRADGIAQRGKTRGRMV